MRTVSVIIMVALASFFLVSCGPKEPDTAALKKTVDEFNAASKDAMMGGDMEKVLAYYEDNAMEMAPNMAVVKGKDAIKGFWEQMMKSGMKMTAVEFTPVDVQAGGAIAYEIGTYDMTMTAGTMGEMKDKGKYITLWREQADGTWKVSAETWNTDMPMPSMEKSTAKKSGTKHAMMSKKGSPKKSAVSKKSEMKKKPAAKKAPAKKKTTSKKSTSKKK
jgi:uncharacterized protein (TIGR02246 family)